MNNDDGKYVVRKDRPYTFDELFEMLRGLDTRDKISFERPEGAYEAPAGEPDMGKACAGVLLTILMTQLQEGFDWETAVEGCDAFLKHLGFTPLPLYVMDLAVRLRVMQHLELLREELQEMYKEHGKQNPERFSPQNYKKDAVQVILTFFFCHLYQRRVEDKTYN